MAAPLRTNVYVDGFNLYYGAVRGTGYKWLDIGKLCRLLLPGNDIQRIRYFTALTQPRPGDPHVQVRQQVFLRALRTIPEVSIHLGTFRQDVRMMKVAPPGLGLPAYVPVIKTEEKGSDVNIASYLLLDCHRRDFDVAVVVSNDTDLLTPIQMVIREFGCRVGLLNPHSASPARSLLQAASFYKPIRRGVLAACQFPAVMSDARGNFSKPASW